MQTLFTEFVNLMRTIFQPPHQRMTTEQELRRLKTIAVLALARMGLEPECVHDLMYSVDSDTFWQQFDAAQERLVTRYADAAERCERHSKTQPVNHISPFEAMAYRSVN